MPWTLHDKPICVPECLLLKVLIPTNFLLQSSQILNLLTLCVFYSWKTFNIPSRSSSFSFYLPHRSMTDWGNIVSISHCSLLPELLYRHGVIRHPNIWLWTLRRTERSARNTIKTKIETTIRTKQFFTFYSFIPEKAIKIA